MDVLTKVIGLYLLFNYTRALYVNHYMKKITDNTY